MIRLRADLGAIPDSPVDSFLAEALEKVAEGRAGGIVIDGTFRLTRKTHFSFLNRQRHHLIMQGHGAASQLIPGNLGDDRALSIHNLESLVLRDFIFRGDPAKPYPKEYDCKAIGVFGTINQFIWDNVHVYGICSPKVNPYGLFWIEACGFEQRSGQVRGSTSVGSGLFTFSNPKRTLIRGPEVLDYGMMDGWYAARTAIGFTEAWYRFVPPYPTNVYRSTIEFEHLSLDEAALYGIWCDGGGEWMRGLRLSDVSVNVREAGLKLYRVEHVTADDCYFTYREEKPVFAIDGVDVKVIRLSHCVADKQARTIRLRRSATRPITADDPMDVLYLDHCKGFIIDAPQTRVVVTPAKPSRFSWLTG